MILTQHQPIFWTGMWEDMSSSETVTLFRPVGEKEIAAFNQNIVGEIQIVAEFRSHH